MTYKRNWQETCTKVFCSVGCWCIYKLDMVLTARYESWSKQYLITWLGWWCAYIVGDIPCCFQAKWWFCYIGMGFISPSPVSTPNSNWWIPDQIVFMWSITHISIACLKGKTVLLYDSMDGWGRSLEVTGDAGQAQQNIHSMNITHEEGTYCRWWQSQYLYPNVVSLVKQWVN